MDNGKATTDHNEIKKWIEDHGGKPAIIDDPSAGSDPVGLKIDFPGKEDEKLLSDNKQKKDITWEEFFKIFDDDNLAFIYNEDSHSSDPTMLYRFINRLFI